MKPRFVFRRQAMLRLPSSFEGYFLSVQICVNLWLRMKVGFVIGGTQKGGTSALDAFLRQHPQICMPVDLKEVHFFDREEMFCSNTLEYEKYHSYFQPERRHKVIGEASPIYMYWNNAPQRIWSYNPQMKWIV